MPSPTDSLPKTYQPHLVEDKWYAEWIKRGYFTSIPNSKTSYTVVIPPPNITGVLHMGHMLNNTIQDVLIRRARMQGYNACWVPGTDHASIATETKVVQMPEEQGIAKSSLTREAFLTHAWNWKEKYGGIILEQLKKLDPSKEILLINKYNNSWGLEKQVNYYSEYLDGFLVGYPPKEVLENEQYDKPYIYFEIEQGILENWMPLEGVSDHVANVYNSFIFSLKEAKKLNYDKVFRIEYDMLFDEEEFKLILNDLDKFENEDFLIYGKRQEGNWSK